MQNDVIREIDASAVMPDEFIESNGGEIVASHFRSSTDEAQALANLVHHWITVKGVSPSEIAILMPRQIAEYGESLMEQLSLTGEDRQAAFQRTTFTHNLLTQGALKAVLVIDCLAQVGGMRVLWHPDRDVTGQGDASGGARLAKGQLSGGIETGSGPEVFMEFVVLGLQAGELHALEQGQAPGRDREDNQQPDDGVFNGFEGGCNQVHGQALQQGITSVLAMRFLSGGPRCVSTG